MTISYRHFKFPDDLPALVNLKNAYFQHHQIDRVTDIDKQKGLLSYPDHDPERDNLVATISDNANVLAAHVWLWEQAPQRHLYDLHVHPDWQRQGIGTQLMQQAIDQITKRGGKYLDTQVSIGNVAHNQYCQKIGFRPFGRYLGMSLGVDVQVPQLPDIADFTIHKYSDVNDINLYTQVMNEAYGDLWGHMADASAEFVVKSLNRYSPDQIFLMFDRDDSLAGFARIYADERTGVYQVDAPGVMPQYRSPDLYRYLLLYSLHQLKSYMTTTSLITMDSWGDFDSTVNTFWELGFELKRHKIGYRYYL